MNIIKKFRKSEKGSITVMVLSAMLFLIGTITVSYFAMSNKSIDQNKKVSQIAKQYKASDEDMEKEYQKAVNNASLTIEQAQSKGMFEKASNTELVDDYEKKVIIPAGFRVTEDATNVTDGIVIEDKEGNQFVWVPVENKSDYVRNASYENVNISSKSYTDSEYLPDDIQPEINPNTTDENEISNINEKVERESVLASGGFYIGRYETGIENGNIIVKSGKGIYKGIFPNEIKLVAKTMYNNAHVKSAVCSGVQWDVMMNFVNGKKDGEGNIFDVTTHSESRSGLGVTGKNEADKVCNIYDIEGNYYEYVAEKNTFNSNFPYNSRGGTWHGNNSASNRTVYNSRAPNAFTFRLVLYVISK